MAQSPDQGSSPLNPPRGSPGELDDFIYLSSLRTTPALPRKNVSLISPSSPLPRNLPEHFRSSREGLFVLKFESGWRSSSCPVEQWYQNERTFSEEQQSFTRFSTILYCKKVDRAFRHEYLLILLADSSIYRIERRGIGSDADAVRTQGCQACDSIEWFPSIESFKLATADSPFQLVLTLQFASEFDILDVLAICYSIQQHPHARRYTLQRYNCYFLCFTILSILVRRVSNWEQVISTGQYSQFIDASLSDLSTSIKSALTAESNPLIRILSMDKKMHDLPLELLIESLREVFETTPGIQQQDLQKVVSSMVWHSDFYTLAIRHLREHFKAVENTFCHKATLSSRTQALGLFLNSMIDNDEDSRGVNLNLFHHRRTILAYACVISAIRVSPNLVAKKRLWVETKLWLKMVCLVTTEFLDLCLPLTFANIAIRTAVHSSGLVPKLLIPPQSHIYEPSMENAQQVLHVLDFYGMRETDEVMAAYLQLGRFGTGNFWQDSIRTLVSEAMMIVIFSKAVSLGGSFQLKRQNQLDTSSVRDFQDVILERIEMHALLVSEANLGSFYAIRRGIEGAISDVWESMPEGFGSH